MSVERAPVTARDIDGGSYLQLFLVTAVVTMLATRFYLTLTGFPRIGRGELHVAHLLWGGLLMLVALVLLLALLGRRSKWVSGLVGGAGFGLFIDELGKFISADNDYLFQPAIALIYIVFMTLFLVFRSIERNALSSAELVANAANQLPDLALGGATQADAARAQALLERSELHGPFAEGLRAAVAGAVRVPDRSPSRTVRVAQWAWQLYDRVREWNGFERAIEFVFVAQALLGLLAITAIALFGPRLVGAGAVLASALSIGEFVCGIVSLGLVLIGVVQLRRNRRLTAYRWFERSVLVSIFFTQVLLFWQDQLAALGGLIWSLALLSAVRFAIHQEEARRAVATVRQPQNQLVPPSAAA